MTEPSQYFKGRTVQEQMNEVIGYVDARAEEVAAAKADDVLEPAEAAKVAAQAAQGAAEDAQDAAEAARDTTLAALPAVNTRIDGVVSDLNAVTLRVTTAEGDIVTIQGRITAVETKNNQQDSAIAALQTADEQNVKIVAINQYAIGLTGNQIFTGVKNSKEYYGTITNYPQNPPDNVNHASNVIRCVSSDNVELARLLVFQFSDATTGIQLAVRNSDGTTKTILLGKGDVI